METSANRKLHRDGLIGVGAPDSFHYLLKNENSVCPPVIFFAAVAALPPRCRDGR
jgi:hypothetical protein